MYIESMLHSTFVTHIMITFWEGGLDQKPTGYMPALLAVSGGGGGRGHVVPTPWIPRSPHGSPYWYK